MTPAAARTAARFNAGNSRFQRGRKNHGNQEDGGVQDFRGPRRQAEAGGNPGQERLNFMDRQNTGGGEDQDRQGTGQGFELRANLLSVHGAPLIADVISG